MYEKVLPSLAELDEQLFEKIRDTYEEIIELSHYRQTLVDYLAGETLAPDPDMTKQLLLDFSDRRDRYFNVLNYGYRALTGKDLDSWKLR